MKTTPLSKAILTILFASSLISCSSISVNRQSISESIVQERQNIITANQLSDNTIAKLRSSGIDESSCMGNFYECVSHVKSTLADINAKQNLALLAELHFAKYNELVKSDTCNIEKFRPAIDKEFSPSTKDIEAEKNAAFNCIFQSQTNLKYATRYSFAYIFYNQLTDNQITRNTYLPNELDIQTLDIYNVATNTIINDLYKTTDYVRSGESNAVLDMVKPFVEIIPISEIKPTKEYTSEHILNLRINDNITKVYIPNSLVTQSSSSLSSNTTHADVKIDKLVPVSEIQLKGLNSISKRQGLGLSYIAQIEDRYTNDLQAIFKQSDTSDNPIDRVHKTGQVLLTGYVQPLGDTIDEVINSKELHVYLHDPYKVQEVTILGESFPLSANFSASYALWLDENKLKTISYANMLSQSQTMTLPRLFMLEPYDPNKRVIIMVHGLASSPATWVGVTNDVLNDETLRENYQVWQVFYPTNIPMIENRYQIQKLLEHTFQHVDSTGEDIASNHNIIISHSMGAVISRMMLSNDNLKAKLEKLSEPALPSLPNDSNTANQGAKQSEPFSNSEIKEAILQAYSSKEVEERFILSPLPQVDTAVFISAPFRGTDFADRWFTRALRKIIQLPIGVSKTIYGNVESIVNNQTLKEQPLGALFLENGASQLSNQSSFMELTGETQIADGIEYHSIIASQDEDIVKGIETMQRYLKNHGANNKSQEEGLRNDSKNRLNGEENNDKNKSENIVATQKVNITTNISPLLTETMSDGIVPYESSHLEGAESETVLSGGHGIHENPQTILVLKNILLNHLKQHPTK